MYVCYNCVKSLVQKHSTVLPVLEDVSIERCRYTKLSGVTCTGCNGLNLTELMSSWDLEQWTVLTRTQTVHLGSVQFTSGCVKIDFCIIWGRLRVTYRVCKLFIFWFTSHWSSKSRNKEDFYKVTAFSAMQLFLITGLVIRPFCMLRRWLIASVLYFPKHVKSVMLRSRSPSSQSSAVNMHDNKVSVCSESRTF